MKSERADGFGLGGKRMVDSEVDEACYLTQFWMTKLLRPIDLVDKDLPSEGDRILPTVHSGLAWNRIYSSIQTERERLGSSVSTKVDVNI